MDPAAGRATLVNHTAVNQTMTGNGTVPGGDGTVPGGEGWFSRIDLTPFIDGFLQLAAFILVLVAAFFVGRMGRALYDRFHRGKQPTSRQLLVGKTIVLVAVVLAVAVGLTYVYDVDLLALVTTLGILSIALGFGLQNTVANMAAGVGLSLDKPFDVGDRIQVGETWGDVESIGLRSTTIVTTGGQHVVIPNAMLDTREVWNSTHGPRSHLRLELPVGISYDSSLELAEYLMLQVARRNDNLLAYPNPVVRARRFGDNQVDLELRVWLKRAIQRPMVVDQLVRGIKHAFDSEGVHFPFPQRTISYLKDLDPPAKAPDFLAGEASTKPTVLVCTRGSAGARMMADRVVEFVDLLGARLVVVNVRAPHLALEDHDAQAAINHYLMRSETVKVPAKGRMEVGDLSDTITRVARDEGARLIIFGRSHRLGFSARWLHREIDELRRADVAPVLELDTDRVTDEDFVAHWRQVVNPPPPDEPEEDQRPESAEEADEEAPSDEDAQADESSPTAEAHGRPSDGGAPATEGEGRSPSRQAAEFGPGDDGRNDHRNEDHDRKDGPSDKH